MFLLPENDSESAINLAEKIRYRIEKTQYEQNDKKFSNNVSIGLHQFSTKVTINQLITKAYNNLYKAKEQGRNQCVID